MRGAGDVDDRAPGQIRRHGRGVERRGHDDQAKIAAGEPGLLRERDAEIRVHAALVELVEDDGPEVPEERVLLQARREDALGREEHRRLRPELALEPDVPPDFPADRPSLFAGDARRQAARGDAPGLQDDHRAVRGERGRDPGRLARARRRRHDHGTELAHPREDLGNQGIDRERRNRHTRIFARDISRGSSRGLRRDADFADHDGVATGRGSRGSRTGFDGTRISTR